MLLRCLYALVARGFYPLVKTVGRYYGFPSTDKQKIDLNVNATKFVNILSWMAGCGDSFDLASASIIRTR
jgi:hypothetical protein